MRHMLLLLNLKSHFFHVSMSKTWCQTLQLTLTVSHSDSYITFLTLEHYLMPSREF